MFTRVSSLIILFSLLNACTSSEDSIQKALDDAIPAIEEMHPQNVGPDVPVVPSSVSYHGKKSLKFGGELKFDLVRGLSDKIVDVEFKSDAERTIRFNVRTEYMGSCSDTERFLTWIELNSDGDVIDSYEIAPLYSFKVEKGVRYLLRIQYSETDGCDRIYNLVSFQ